VSNYTLVEVWFGGALKHKFRTSSLSSENIYVQKLVEYGEYEITSDGVVNEISQSYLPVDIDFIHDSAILRSHISPIYNEQIDVFGWYSKINTEDVLLETGVPVVSSSEYFDSHLVMSVTSISGSTPITVTISGTVHGEESDLYTTALEEITVTGTGYYRTYNYYIDKPVLSVSDEDKSLLFDLYRACPWSARNEYFTINGCSLSWVPDSEEWFINLGVYHYKDNGSLGTIDYVEFRYDDEYKRASVGKSGSYRMFNYDTSINGANGEGLIVIVDQAYIDVFNLEIRYTVDYVESEI